MRNALTAMLLAFVAGGLGTGCAAPSRTAEPAVQTFTFVDAAGQETLWEASQDVLREYRFDLDRVDRRAGVITTRPVTSQHFFEFWRKDVATPFDYWEATLRTVRRRAEVDINFDEQAGTAALTLTVERELFASPERQYNNSIAAFQMFGTALPAVQTGERVTAADEYWIADGRDPALEQLLLRRIRAYAGG